MQRSTLYWAVYLGKWSEILSPLPPKTNTKQTNKPKNPKTNQPTNHQTNNKQTKINFASNINAENRQWQYSPEGWMKGSKAFKLLASPRTWAMARRPITQSRRPEVKVMEYKLCRIPSGSGSSIFNASPTEENEEWTQT